MTFLMFLLLIASIYFIFLVRVKFEDLKQIADAIEKRVISQTADKGIQLCNIAAVIGILAIALIIGAYIGN